MKVKVLAGVTMITTIVGLSAFGSFPGWAALAAAPMENMGTSSFVNELPPSFAESFSYQSNRGLSVQYSIPDGASGEVFNHASGTADAFFQFTLRAGSDDTFQILVYADSSNALLTRTFVIPGYAPVITVPPKARVVIKDPIDEESDSITGLVTIG
jgi:hypothetical protein